MPHRIGKREDISRALIRLAGDDLAAAEAELRGTGAGAARIHRVRQRIKRVRSLLRVMEPGLGDRAVAVRKALTEAARLLAGARDADVAAASARSLAKATAAQPDVGLDRVVEALENEAARAHREKTPVRDVSRRLAGVRADIAAFDDAAFDGGALLAAALARAYRNGRRSMRRARTSLATPDLHRWRKQVKDFWHLLRLARKRLGKSGRTIAAPLERLGELLGLDHDHALLAERLALSPAGDPSLMGQLSLIAGHRRALEAEAFDLGRRIYKSRPGDFADRLHLD